MDQQIEEVLGIYHARLEKEMQALRSGAPPTPAGGGDWRDQALLAVGPETGRLLNIVVRSLRAPTILEIGTSFGYSGIWLAEAARATQGRVITLELAAHKSAYAREMAAKAGLEQWIDHRVGDALALIDSLPSGIDFVLVDLWKDLYVPCLERFYPKLNPGAIIVADNMLLPDPKAAALYREAVRAKPGIRSVMLPVGSGIEISCLERN
jgi:predicted O-methyltransferase YrrM